LGAGGCAARGLGGAEGVTSRCGGVGQDGVKERASAGGGAAASWGARGGGFKGCQAVADLAARRAARRWAGAPPGERTSREP
jgi:hypothetical protein